MKEVSVMKLKAMRAISVATWKVRMKKKLWIVDNQ